jgi:hypothetical protein
VLRAAFTGPAGELISRVVSLTYRDSSVMLERLNSSLDEELDVGDGLWSSAQFEAMDATFVAAVELAFRLGGESRGAAGAIGSSRNGREAAIEGAIEGAWNMLCHNKGEMAAAEVLAFVWERCPGVDVMRIRSEFDWRFRQRRAEWA